MLLSPMRQRLQQFHCTRQLLLAPAAALLAMCGHAAGQVECRAENGSAWELAAVESGGRHGYTFLPAAAAAQQQQQQQPVVEMTLGLMQDSTLVLPGLTVNVRCSSGFLAAPPPGVGDSPPELGASEDSSRLQLMDSLEGLGFWEAVSSNLIATMLLCVLLGLAVGLEAKFKCLGRKKIEKFEAQNAKLRDKIGELASILDGGGSEGEGGGARTLADSPAAQDLLGRMLGHLQVPEDQQSVVISLCAQLSSSSAEAQATMQALLKSGAVPAEAAQQYTKLQRLREQQPARAAAPGLSLAQLGSRGRVSPRPDADGRHSTPASHAAFKNPMRASVRSDGGESPVLSDVYRLTVADARDLADVAITIGED